MPEPVLKCICHERKIRPRPLGCWVERIALCNGAGVGDFGTYLGPAGRSKGKAEKSRANRIQEPLPKALGEGSWAWSRHLFGLDQSTCTSLAIFLHLYFQDNGVRAYRTPFRGLRLLAYFRVKGVYVVIVHHKSMRKIHPVIIFACSGSGVSARLEAACLIWRSKLLKWNLKSR